LKNLVTDFDVPISKDNNDMLSGELQLLIIDCCELLYSLRVYGKLISEEYSANTLLFSEYYKTVRDALVFRCVLSFSRLFETTHKEALSLLKTLNRFLQNAQFKNNKEIKLSIQELIDLDSQTKSSFDFKTIRDKYFAHLDKKKRFSCLAAFKSLENLDELISLMEKLILKLSGLYKCCYQEDAFVFDKEIDIPDIRNLKDFDERAERFISQTDIYSKRFELTNKGITYKSSKTNS